MATRKSVAGEPRDKNGKWTASTPGSRWYAKNAPKASALASKAKAAAQAAGYTPPTRRKAKPKRKRT